MVTIRPLKRKEQIQDPNKVVVISTYDYSSERHYCLMCAYGQCRYDSIMKYDKNAKVWRCCVCRCEVDVSLGQTPKTEDKPTIENDSTNTKPIVIPPKNFDSAYNNAVEKEESSIRPFQFHKPKYQTAR
jgi:hypothetical protein